ncbi:MAG: hypothetical protein K2X55_00065 [Burkholderiaceae bacterium]|nr:hypothetical protein [Burkholderiaceae bacterium]
MSATMMAASLRSIAATVPRSVAGVDIDVDAGSEFAKALSHVTVSEMQVLSAVTWNGPGKKMPAVRRAKSNSFEELEETSAMMRQILIECKFPFAI